MNDGQPKALEILVSGRVQKVGYRWAVAREAERVGVSGWVCNLDDGRVQALVVGTDNQLEAMVAYMGEGPMTARVKDLQSREVEPPKRLTGFRITEEPQED